MNPALLIRLRPTTPWRIGPDTGAGDQASAVLHSDALYSAVTLALRQLGVMEEWLSATSDAYAEPAVRFTSMFPWQRSFLYAPPPASLWPPAETSGKVRWKGARLLPSGVIAALMAGRAPADDEWVVDGHSGCLIPSASRSAIGPLRYVRRSSAAVDRVTGGRVEAHRSTAIQFAPASGMWCAAEFRNQNAYAVWAPHLMAAFRLLADSGIGGLRSRGFGRSRMPDFQPGSLCEFLFGAEAAESAPTGAWWLLSLFSPAEAERIDWTTGCYQLTHRSGRMDGGAEKLMSRMVVEGSVLVSSEAPRGVARDVAPEGASHPVYRAGAAVALPIPWPVNA